MYSHVCIRFTVVYLHPEDNFTIFFSFPPYLDLSPPPLHSLYTSESSRLTIPCSIPAHISWEQIKAKGFKNAQWEFFPKTGSTLASDAPQRLFNLSLENPQTRKAAQERRWTPVKDPKNKNLSLTTNRVRKEDRGDYVCILEFEKQTLRRTVTVEVLQSKSKQIALYKHSSVLYSHLSYEI